MCAHPKVSILSLHFPPEPTGNAPYVGALACGLVAAGITVEAHVGHPHYPEWRFQAATSNWTARSREQGVAVTRRRHWLPRPPRGLTRLVSEISFGARLLLGSWGNPDVVVAVSPALFATAIAAIRLKLTRKRPHLIIWLQDIYALGLSETGQGGTLATNATRRIERWTLECADQVVVVHERFADYLANELGLDRGKIDVIRNWTHLSPTDRIHSAPARVSLGWPTQSILAVHTGNIGAKQGLLNLVESAKIADSQGLDVTFIIVGDGNERAKLESAAVGVKSIRFVDPLNDVEYGAALAAADVLLVNEKPGVSGMSVPSKLTSYFDAGKPVVAACDPNGITASEIRASRAGIVVESGQPQALLEAVCTLMLDADARSALGKAGRLYREQVLDQSVALSRWTALVRSVGTPSIVA